MGRGQRILVYSTFLDYPFTKRPTNIGFSDIYIIVMSSASISSLIGLVIITFVPIKVVYVLSISYPILLYFDSSWSPSVWVFLFGTTRFCHPSTLTYPLHTYIRLPFFVPPLSSTNSVCFRLFFLDAVSHRMFHLFLALGFDEMKRACVVSAWVWLWSEI